MTQSQCQGLGEFVTSCFTVFSCVLLMCCGNWCNVFCLQVEPRSPAVLQQHFPEGNISPALSVYTCQRVSNPPCAHPFWCLLIPPGFQEDLILLFPSQASCLPFGKAVYPFLWKAAPRAARALSNKTLLFQSHIDLSAAANVYSVCCRCFA